MDGMKPGTVQLGPASLHLGYTSLAPPHLRGRLREISSLVVDQASRGHGAASALMKAVIEQADINGVALLVHVEPFGDCPVNEYSLRQWYQRLGFDEIQVMPCIMVRKPQRVTDD
jgi:GNAT superfamily N-acetyltransferase